MIRAAAGIALLSGLLALGPLSRSAAGDDLAAYTARVERWHAAVARAHQLSATGDSRWRRVVKRVALEAQRASKVDRPAGGAVTVTHAWLAEELERALQAKDARQREQALKRAGDSLAAYAMSLSPAPAVSRAHIKAALAQALPLPPPVGRMRGTWLKRLLERLMDWLGRTFGLLERAHPSARWVVWVVLGVLAGAVLLLLGLMARSLLRRSARQPRSASLPAEAGMPWAPPDPDAALSRARQAAAAGRFGDAIRDLYLALLLRLDGAGLVRFHPATANWEYFGELSGEELRSQFASFTVVFDRKCYGGEAAARADYDRCEELFGRTLALAGWT